MRIVGCEVRIVHTNEEALKQLQHALREFYEDPINDEIQTSGPRLWVLTHKMNGNLDLTAWIHRFGADLEDLDTDGMLPHLYVTNSANVVTDKQKVTMTFELMTEVPQ